MKFNFFISKTPLITAPVALRTVYEMYAGRKYDVKKQLTGNKDLVALRTTGGMGTLKISGIPEMTVYPETLVLFKHSDIRRYYCSSETWDFWWFEFFSAGIPDFPLNTVLQVPQDENEKTDCSACMELLRKNNTGSGYLASATFCVLLYKWMLYYENSCNTKPHYETVHKVINHIKTNLDKNLQVSALAQITGLCERRFRQVFTEITGMQPKKYIFNLRMDMAEELLKNTPLSIYEIGYKLGYSSQYHFSNDFHKSHGLSPSAYRITQ